MTLAAGLLLVSSGCSMFSGSSAKTADSQLSVTSISQATSPTRLTYTTESSRLNLVAAAQGGGSSRQVSFEQSGSAVPEFTECRVTVVAPHPQGLPGMAQVYVMFAEDTEEESSGIGALWSRMTGGQEEGEATSAARREIWSMNIPAENVEKLVERLRKDHFFRREKMLNADATLLTEIDGRRFGKPTAAIDELDALALRARQQGQLAFHSGMGSRYASTAGAPPASGNLRRLPAVR